MLLLTTEREGTLIQGECYDGKKKSVTNCLTYNKTAIFQMHHIFARTVEIKIINNTITRGIQRGGNYSFNMTWLQFKSKVLGKIETFSFSLTSMNPLSGLNLRT